MSRDSPEVLKFYRLAKWALCHNQPIDDLLAMLNIDFIIAYPESSLLSEILSDISKSNHVTLLSYTPRKLGRCFIKTIRTYDGKVVAIDDFNPF